MIDFQIEYETIVMIKKLVHAHDMGFKPMTGQRITELMYVLIHLNMLEGREDNFEIPVNTTVEDLSVFLNISISNTNSFCKMASKLGLIKVVKAKVDGLSRNNYTILETEISDKIYKHLSNGER